MAAADLSPPLLLGLSESYFAVKGAAVVLSHTSSVILPRTARAQDDQPDSTALHPPAQGDIQMHLTAMLHLLRPQDTLKMAVRLESAVGGVERTRYMAIVSTLGRQDNAESAIVGIDVGSSGTATIGLVLPIYAATGVDLDGEGSIRLALRAPPSPTVFHVFKPVSVQAMWSAFQSLVKETWTAGEGNYYDGGLTHTWVPHYAVRVASPEAYRAEWHYYLPMEDHEARLQADSLQRFQQKPADLLRIHARIRQALKDIMHSVDLDEVNTRDIRLRLEHALDMKLGEHKGFFDQEMMTILGQMEKPSRIFPYLYLGTEWNASNWDELNSNSVSHILNVTKEVDNFFQSQFNYMKIAVSDEASSELLGYWDQCSRFIRQAREGSGAVLVHCKKGISRSSSTVIAFAMKEFGWSLEQALEYVKEKRQCITPNKGFMHQLKTYQGILDASRHRNSALWNPCPSAPALSSLAGKEAGEEWAGVGRRDSASSASSVTYSHVAEHPDSRVPALVAMSSGNILKPGRPSHPSSDALDDHLSPSPSTSNTIHVTLPPSPPPTHPAPLQDDAEEGPSMEPQENGLLRDELPPSCFKLCANTQDENTKTYFRGIRPRVKPELLNRLERSESEPLNRLQRMVVSSKARDDAANLSSSGISCSSESSESLSDPIHPPSSPSRHRPKHRRNSKSSTGDSGDSAVDDHERLSLQSTSEAAPMVEETKPSRLKQAKAKLTRLLTKEESHEDGCKGPKSKWLKNLHQKKTPPETMKPSPSLNKCAQGTVRRTAEQLERVGKGPYCGGTGWGRHLRLCHSYREPVVGVGLVGEGAGDEKLVRSLVERFDPGRLSGGERGVGAGGERERRRTLAAPECAGTAEAEGAEEGEGPRLHRRGSLSSPIPSLATPIITRAMSCTFHLSPRDYT